MCQLRNPCSRYDCGARGLLEYVKASKSGLCFVGSATSAQGLPSMQSACPNPPPVLFVAADEGANRPYDPFHSLISLEVECGVSAVLTTASSRGPYLQVTTLARQHLGTQVDLQLVITRRRLPICAHPFPAPHQHRSSCLSAQTRIHLPAL